MKNGRFLFLCYPVAVGIIIKLPIWLDEEYGEPPKPEVDWGKVPVDTLVRVKDFEGEEWVLRYFKEIDENCEESKYVTWIAGSTSKTAYGFTEYWNHCELVEDEDDSN